eukprot:6434839-Alexandrium_andersonii.AAC.1
MAGNGCGERAGRASNECGASAVHVHSQGQSQRVGATCPAREGARRCKHSGARHALRLAPAW